MRKRTPLEMAVFASGKTRVELAKAAHINLSTLSLVITGKQKPRLETSLRLSAALDSTPEQLGLIGISNVIGEVRNGHE